MANRDITSVVERKYRQLEACQEDSAKIDEQVRNYAPYAFQTQERAVTVEDYAAMAGRHPEVQKAVAVRRWTGSWHTTFIAVDRKGNKAVDVPFIAELRQFLERFRLAGHDLEIIPPVFVPLDIILDICLKPDYSRSQVKLSLLKVFSNQNLVAGEQGFFHPDRWTFGQTVHCSRLIATAMAVPGVRWVEPKRVKRWLRQDATEVKETLTMGMMEIARLDNDPNAPENGKIDFMMEGGL